MHIFQNKKTHTLVDCVLHYDGFITILGVTETLCNFRLFLEGKTGKEMSESSKLEFLEKFLANNFALSNAEDNTSSPFNRGGIADLPLCEHFAESFKSQVSGKWALSFY